jgi:uncharacterized membrane protein YeaQ/YmgE (transglycosylase-associated protein family)
MLAFGASNLWFYYLGPYLILNLPSRTVLPDFFSYLQIDAYVGAGCGYAGALTGPNIASLLGSQHRLSRWIPVLYTAVLGATVTLIVNALLLLMSYI